MPATAVTRPPAIAGPRSRNFRCAKTSLGFSAGWAWAIAPKAPVATQLTERSTAAALTRKEFRVIVGFPSDAGALETHGLLHQRSARYWRRARGATIPSRCRLGIHDLPHADSAWSQAMKRPVGALAPTGPFEPTALPARSARRALRLLADSARLLGLRHAAADIHEAAALDAIGRLAARGMGGEARARRDEPADDDVLLQAAQVVLETAHRRLREDTGGLLEGGRGDEGLRREGRLGDAEQHRLQGRQLLAVLLRAIVDVERARPVELLAAQESGLARRLHLGLAQHLADDHLDVLVVDLHALQAVDVLDLAHEVVSQRLDALQAQDVVRVRLAVGDHLAALDRLTLEHVELAPLRDQLLVLLAVVARDDQAPLALGLLAEADGARLLREDGRVLRFPRFEEIRHARQTAGDVTGLRRLLRDAGDDVTDRHPRAV